MEISIQAEDAGIFGKHGLFHDYLMRFEIRDLRKALIEIFQVLDISPTIFGAVFESTLNPETRRVGETQYASLENIHKVVDPLFLDGLKEELKEIDVHIPYDSDSCPV